MMAAQADWHTGAKPEKRSIHEVDESTLPELSHPCKYSVQAGKVKVLCSYRQQGVWKKHQRSLSVNAAGDNSSFEAIVRGCEAEVLAFYNSNHDKGGPDDGGDDQLPPPHSRCEGPCIPARLCQASSSSSHPIMRARKRAVPLLAVIRGIYMCRTYVITHMYNT